MIERRGWAFGVVLAAAAFSTLAGCADPVDKAAKQRIFSPEDPPQAIASAKETLRPEDVADKQEVARRILGMGAAEATERLGPHKFTAQVKFEWTAGKRNLKLSEQRMLLAGAGGVNGDFHASEENSRDQGFEVMRVQNSVYARNRYGKFRQRKRDRGMAERVRDEVHGVIRDFDSLYLGRMKLAPQGTVTYEGRTAWRYKVSLGPDTSKKEEKKADDLPPVQKPRMGVDDTTRRRAAFAESREPMSLDGEVFVDAKTSVVLKARLDGRIKQPKSDLGGEATLSTSMTMDVTGIGKNPTLAAPKDFLPDEDKPEGIASALERFGIETGNAKPDAGTPQGAEEPPDEAP